MFTGNLAAGTPGHDSRRTAPVRLGLFNVKYSPNLGDGLLSECLENALCEAGASAAGSTDLAARTTWTRGSASRGRILHVLQALPPRLRRWAIRAPLWFAARRIWSPHYHRTLKDADAIVIGGGNLLADLDLNFPTKLALVIRAASERDLPVYIYGVGVSDGWSAAGQRLLHSALRTGAVRQVFVRDERSRMLWDRLAGERFHLRACIVRDPGLLAVRRYAPCSSQSAKANRGARCGTIGINITSELALGYHADTALSRDALEDWYHALAVRFAKEGWHLAFFTNGSPEDRATLERLRPRLEPLAGRISFPDPATPHELVTCIAALDGLVAFRMHAIIAAYSCAVPFIALAWDPKLASFVASVDRTDWLIDVEHTPAEMAAQALIAAMDRGICGALRDEILAETRRGVERLFAAIVDDLGHTTCGSSALASRHAANGTIDPQQAPERARVGRSKGRPQSKRA